MDLSTFIADIGRRRALAHAVSCSPVYLYQIATARRRASTDLATAIETASAAIGPAPVSRASLRPDVWTEAA